MRLLASLAVFVVFLAFAAFAHAQFAPITLWQTQQDDTPATFSYTTQTLRAWNTVISSSTPTISGIGPSPVAVSISGSGSPEFQIAGGSWVTTGFITSGQTLRLRLTTANSGGTTYVATVTVGTMSRTFSVTTNAGNCNSGGEKFSGSTACWYAGASGSPTNTCTSVCSTHGGYHADTMNFAGSAGTTANCWDIATFFGYSDSLAADSTGSTTQAAGCGSVQDGNGDWISRRYLGLATTAASAPPEGHHNYGTGKRFCGCSN